MIMETRDKYDFDFSGKTVLVVEDTLMSFKLIETVLSRVQAEVVHAADGAAAIKMCNCDNAFDLVIMDLQMPGVNGIEATREIKKINPALPIIIATANSFNDDEAACREAGCDSFLIKPLKFKSLFKLMDSYFQR
jgi:CheY-like chemotaxis protein